MKIAKIYPNNNYGILFIVKGYSPSKDIMEELRRLILTFVKYIG